ncbi:MAG: hypothetical protein AAF824_02975, partial [Bacteroidota bacterium]
KSIIGADLGDTSFVNTSFKANEVDYTEGMSACDQLSAATLADLYGVSEDMVLISDPTKMENSRFVGGPSCMIHIKLSDIKGDHLTGTISLAREVGKEEFMGEIAEATGGGENWEEAWALKKAMYESAEWMEGMGLAALWTGNKRMLEIKFKGYTLSMIAPGAAFNQEENSRNRDYQKIAVALAKSAGYIQ